MDFLTTSSNFSIDGSADSTLENLNIKDLTCDDALSGALAPPPLKRSVAGDYSRDNAFNIADIEKEAEQHVLDPSGAAWVPLVEQDIMEMFGELTSFRDGEGLVEWDKIDYQDIYGADWYKAKYPSFPDEWYELLAQASREKYKDLTKKQESGFTHEEGNFIVRFGKNDDK